MDITDLMRADPETSVTPGLERNDGAAPRPGALFVKHQTVRIGSTRGLRAAWDHVDRRFVPLAGSPWAWPAPVLDPGAPAPSPTGASLVPDALFGVPGATPPGKHHSRPDSLAPEPVMLTGVSP